MEQMAGVLIGDAERHCFERSGETKGVEKFGNVADLGAKRDGLLVFGFVLSEQMIVFLQRRATTCSVRHDGIEIFAEERGDIFAGEFAGGITHSGVSGESTAAKLASGDDHFAAVGGQHADGGFVELREGDLGDAAGEERDASAARSGSGEGTAELREEKGIVDAREKALAIG